MINNFKDKVAVITGGGHGIGLSIAKSCLEQGMKVVITASRQSSVDEATKKLNGGDKLLALVSDAGDPNAVTALAEKVKSTFGKVNFLCLNAGISRFAPIQELTVETWEQHINVNLNGPFYAVKAFMPLLEQEDESHIVITSSIFAFITNGFQAPYFASKAGVTAFAEALYYDLMFAESKIGISLLCPGNTSTNMANANLTDDVPTEIAEAIKAELAQGTDPQVVAEATLQAVRENQFYVLPNSGEFQAAVDARFARIQAQRNPTVEDTGGAM